MSLGIHETEAASFWERFRVATMGPSRLALWLLIFFFLGAGESVAQKSPFQRAVDKAKRLLTEGDAEKAKEEIDLAVERDAQSRTVWALWEEWGRLSGDSDEEIYALHRQHRLAIAQGAPRGEVKTLEERLRQLDPIAPDLLDMKNQFIESLLPIAQYYEEQRRPHSAIRVHQEILSIDPEFELSRLAIEKISAAPDPSLAETAKPKDLLADVSEEFIANFDARHQTWDRRSKLERENYTTHTNAGYEVMVRAAEAMEQMNAFYRVFFAYGAAGDNRSVPRIDLRIFATRDEYLKFGSSPVEWSGGQFTGSAVETFVGNGGFAGMTNVLFHEAAHQFVSLATSAIGWLNEGLASFFEGCQITANGTVLMNLPANHRLFPLASRMENGWMDGAEDGIDGENPNTVPNKAPRWGTILRNRYRWGPAWYAPTWGVVYFLYNYQDPRDGRFVYRQAFRKYIDESGYRSGEGAIALFEDVVLSNPSRPTPGVDLSELPGELALPRTVVELDEVWKDWILKLRDEQVGQLEVERPYLTWARHAMTRRHFSDASEFFEKGLNADPEDIDLLTSFARFLVENQNNSDRATKLLIQAIRTLERAETPNEPQIEEADKLLAKWDPRHRQIRRIHDDLWKTSSDVAQSYLDRGFPKMAMEVSWRLGTELGVPGIFDIFEDAVRKSGKTLALWELAYNEQNLEGWNSSGATAYKAMGQTLVGEFDEFKKDDFRFQFLTLDRITSGDFSMEAEVFAQDGEVGFAGLVFGQKDSSNFQSVILFPGQKGDAKYNKKERTAYLDLTTFYGAGEYQIWRHLPVAETQSNTHVIRIDVTGPFVDVSVDGTYLTTQEFSTKDVLRGSFGLIMGPGKAQFRNIRFLARPPLDFGAMIERQVRMEKIQSGGKTDSRPVVEGEEFAVNGSWIGKVPRWLKSVRWIQGERTSWNDRGPVPQVLVFWSIAQNNGLPIHQWLSSLAERYADVGLEIVSIATFQDASAMPGYLAQNAFPGSVGADQLRGTDYGEAFEAYLIDRFGMPRVLLLDVDHKVIWEGDPGFRHGEKWSEGDASYLDTPLEDLIVRRGLRLVKDWIARWQTEGVSALRSGDILTAVSLMKEGAGFGPNLDPVVSEVRERYQKTKQRLSDPQGLVEDLISKQAEAAAPALDQWFEAFEVELGRSVQNELKSARNSARGKVWRRIMTQIARAQKRLKPGSEAKPLADLMKSLNRMEGLLPQNFAAKLDGFIQAEDFGEAILFLEEAEGYPARWFASEYLGW